ncbi:hypothetical protein DPMN_058644 [Dreissena polymorpha]|uniref:Uncharacterized protein n=1 Tax=Dreissena polymorpha TaxID=45954 RepID=A0A9D4C249_DREPO|nr:hypothetical protein DPMN_058644 [Dreissena polymorpha]
MAQDTKVTDGQQDGQPDNAKTISLRLWRGIYTHTKFQGNPPKHFQDMAPDTKVPILFQDIAPDTKVTDGQPDGQPDNAKTISLRLWRGIYTHTKFQGNPPKHFQDMAPDTKVPIIWLRTQKCRTDGRYDGRTDSRTDGRTDNAKTISLRLWRGIKMLST